MIAWESGDDQDGDLFGVYAKRYDTSGNELPPPPGSQRTGQGNEFQVNTETSGDQFRPNVEMDLAGNFVITWISGFPQDQDGSNRGVFAKRYDATGNELPPPFGTQGTGQGNEFQVNSFTTNGQWRPEIGMDSQGNFVITWKSVGQDGSKKGIFAKAYDAGGNEIPPAFSRGTGVGNEFQVNTFTTNDQRRPAIAMNDGGSIVIAWQSDDQDGSGAGIISRLYRSVVIEVAIDITPQSCPNSLKVNGSTRVAILGTAEFDATQVDPASVRLEGVTPSKSKLKDVATPFEPFTGKADAFDCTDAGPDGFLDFIMKFDRPDIVEAIELALGREVEDGEVLILTVEGVLFDGTPIVGEDVVVIKKRGGE